MRIDQVENLIADEVTEMLEDMARKTAGGVTKIEGRLILDFDAIGVDFGQASAALQLVGSRVR